MVYREHDCSKVNSSFWCVLVGGGVGLDVPSPPPQDLLVGFPMGFLKPTDIPRRKPGCPGQCHTERPEGDPGEGAGQLAESRSSFNLGHI